MTRNSINARVSKDYWTIRRLHKQQLQSALKGLKISDVQLDAVYSRKLKNINILEEFNLRNNKI